MSCRRQGVRGLQAHSTALVAVGLPVRPGIRRAVEARSTNRVGSTMGSLARERAPLMMASRLCTAVPPSACSGAATVVSRGVTRSAAKMLSKPMMLTSSGTADAHGGQTRG